MAIIGVFICGIVFLILSYWLETRCKHKWVLYKRVDIYDEPDDTMPTGSKLVDKCENCGKLRIQFY